MPNLSFGTNLNSVPSPTRQTLASNYIDFRSATGNNWAQQYVPDLMEKEAEVFGPRTISGFLSQVGAEEPMTSDQVIWSEQGRLHLSYKGTVTNAGGAVVGGIGATADLLTLTNDIDGNALTGGVIDHGIRVNDTVIVANGNEVRKCVVVATPAAGNTVEVFSYDGTALTTDATVQGTTVLVYGSEFSKGQSYHTTGTGAAADARPANEPQFKSFSNKPIILKDYYEVSGSDASRVGWVEVASEMGESGYLWYLKAESDTRARFADYLEMAMLESELGSTTSETPGTGFLPSATSTAGNDHGTEGLFAALLDRSNITAGIDGVVAANDLAEFDAILAEFDKQGAIEENMIFCNRSVSLAIDDMLASMNGYYVGGTSYGVFDNSEDMALNLGFSGFRRGSYDFYKSDFRYLNDKATRGGINDAAGTAAIRGVFIPAGTSTVYDQILGKNLKRPFLHVRYRASQTDDRRMKSWVTGSVGAATSALDAMQVHFLSERCLVTQGANNFVLMQ